MAAQKPFHIINTKTGKVEATFFGPDFRVSRPAVRSTRMRLTPEKFQEALAALVPGAKMESRRNAAAFKVLCDGMPPAEAANAAKIGLSNVVDLVGRIERHVTEQNAKEFE